MKENKNLAPIAVFAYNRPDHLTKTLVALSKNIHAQNSILYIFCDGPKGEHEIASTNEVIKVARSQQWSQSTNVEINAKNMGLAHSIVRGVTNVVNLYGKIIVLEDDMITSPYFLKYMNEALTMYETESKVMHISGFVPPIKDVLPESYFLRYMSCWGWATWSDAWDKREPNSSLLLDEIQKNKLIKEFNIGGSYPNLIEQLEKNVTGKLNTWAIQWYASIFINEGLCLYPDCSFIINIGLDSSGTNSGTNNLYKIENLKLDFTLDKILIKENIYAFMAFKRFYKSINRLYKLKVVMYKLYLKLKK